MKRLTIVLAVLGSMAVLAGCGSDDGGGQASAQGEAPTRREYIAAADAICVEATERIEAGYADFIGDRGGRPSQAQLREAVETVLVPGLRERLAELRALEQPQGDAAELEDFFAASEEGIESVEADPETMLGGSEYPFAEAARLAKLYGLVECRKA